MRNENAKGKFPVFDISFRDFTVGVKYQQLKQSVHLTVPQPMCLRVKIICKGLWVGCNAMTTMTI